MGVGTVVGFVFYGCGLGGVSRVFESVGLLPCAVLCEPMHKVQQCGGTNRDFCGPVWVKNKPISVPAIVKPFCTALEKGISNIEKNS